MVNMINGLRSFSMDVPGILFENMFRDRHEFSELDSFIEKRRHHVLHKRPHNENRLNQYQEIFLMPQKCAQSILCLEKP
jgi:hypothetical protein